MPMLSILIPIFNFDVRELVEALSSQGKGLSMPVEILCFDDGSEEQWKGLNRAIEHLPFVQYRELQSNLGRSRIRNALADEARGTHLLFLDCDSALPDGGYLRRYASLMDGESLLYGGRAYQDSPPHDARFFLHWKYGTLREQMAPEQRRIRPYHHFMTNNFLIPSSVFQAIRFDERLLRYGHEDTLFGMELYKRQIPLLHIANPLVHIGLEPASVFLKKNEEGIRNLAFLYTSGTGIETRLLAFYEKIKRTGLTFFFKKALALLRPRLYRNLLSPRPKLRFLDLYKLSLLLEEL